MQDVPAPTVGCIKRTEEDKCCEKFDFNETALKEKYGRDLSNDCEYVCPQYPINCLSLIKNRIIASEKEERFFLPEEEESFNFTTTLRSIHGLSYEGVLDLTIGINITWQNDGLRWDEDCNECEDSKNSNNSACEIFLARTRHKKHFITQLPQTKSKDFILLDDKQSAPLSKTLEGFPLMIYRNGLVEWSGVIQISVLCHLDLIRFPIDEQACDIAWLPLPRRVDGLTANFLCEDREDRSENADWEFESFHKVENNERDHGFCRIILKRRAVKYVGSLVFPFVLTNYLIAWVYYLPPASGERVGYSVTLVLSFSMLLMSIDDMVPPSEDILPASEYY